MVTVVLKRTDQKGFERYLHDVYDHRSPRNHHFLTPEDGTSFRFIEGHYKLEVFAHLLGDPKPIRLFFQELDISHDVATALQKERSAGLYFDWGPDSSRYLPHVENPLLREKDERRVLS